jgi:alpha-ketoglutarate-dependent taurine dioxygenase
VSRDPEDLQTVTNDLLVTRSIVGLKKEESEALLAFLFNHIGRGVDYQARVRWAPKTVVVWDVSA